MKKRFLLLNIIIIVIILIFNFAYQNYLDIRSQAFGQAAYKILSDHEQVLINDLSTLEFSIYSTQTSELNQVRNDIMTQYSEADFRSITVQPQASFIDTLLFDSKLKDFMNNSSLNKSNKSLLSKMKLYLPNELLISFSPELKTIDQIISIQDYLQENDYVFLESDKIPSVKSNIKHYYFNKEKFSSLMNDFKILLEKKEDYRNRNQFQNYFEAINLFIILLILTLFIQLVDYYLKNKYLERINFLLKGHISPRKYHNKLFWNKSIALFILLVVHGLYLVPQVKNVLQTDIDIKNSICSVFLLLLNITLFSIKKERIEI